MQDLSRRLQSIMVERGLNQQAAAEYLGVSQPTISRIIKGEIKIRGPAVRRVEQALKKAVANKNEYSEGVSGSAERLVEAVYAVWDGSEEHADALEKLLNAIQAYRKRTDGTSP